MLLRAAPSVAILSRATAANASEGPAVDSESIDSCHTVWMELHEDLLATLGLKREQNRSNTLGR